jgi:hypothetical protein
LVVVVWGDRYLNTFLSLALPSFLAAGNLPYCSSVIATKLVVVTDREGAIALRASAVMEAAGNICAVEIRENVTDSLKEQPNKYHTMATCHHEVVKDLQGQDSVLSILSPDCLLSNGCLRMAINKIFDGYRAVLVPGPRASLQGAAAEVARLSKEGVITSLSAEFLVSILVKHPHPISKAVYYQALHFSKMPSCIYWKSGNNSFFAKYFHLHPLLVRVAPSVRFPDSHTGTVDATLIDDAGVALDECFVGESSDDLLVIEVTDETVSHIPNRIRLLKPLFVWRWARLWATRRHVETFLRYTFVFRGPGDAAMDATPPYIGLRFLLVLLERRLRWAAG